MQMGNKVDTGSEAMSEESKNKAPSGKRLQAGVKVARLFESPYVIGSPEAPADLSRIGNGRGELIDRALDEMLEELPEDEAALLGQLELEN
jgi:hypothetical protein